MSANVTSTKPDLAESWRNLLPAIHSSSVTFPVQGHKESWNQSQQTMSKGFIGLKRDEMIMGLGPGTV